MAKHSAYQQAVFFSCGHCGATHDVEEIRRSLYISHRALGDYLGLHRGDALGDWLARRALAKRLTRSLWGDLRARLSFGRQRRLAVTTLCTCAAEDELGGPDAG